MVQIRIGFIGDSITHGTGDTTLLGWPYRLGREEVGRGHDVTVYNLGVRADTSELVAARWAAECEARLQPPHRCATVFAVGINDSADEESAAKRGRRVELERSVDLVSQMVTQAQRLGPALWVGPTPVVEAMMPVSRTPGLSYDFRNGTIGAYSRAYGAKATDLAVPYLDLFTPLSGDPRWSAALRRSDGLHPNADGYEIMAAHIGGWSA